MLYITYIVLNQDTVLIYNHYKNNFIISTVQIKVSNQCMEEVLILRKYNWNLHTRKLY